MNSSLGAAKFLPMPPSSYRKNIGRAKPMSVEDVQRIVAAYNRFVETWNRYEQDLSLPPPPLESEDGHCSAPHPPYSALWWTDYHTGRWCIIRVHQWRGWAPNRLCQPWLRNPIDIDHVAWAGWLT